MSFSAHENLPLPIHVKRPGLSHTVEELWGDVAPEKRENYEAQNPIRPVASNYIVPENSKLTDEAYRTAFICYNAAVAREAAYQSWLNPSYERFIDRIRWGLHKLLIRWKVII